MGNVLTGGENYIHIGKERGGWRGCPHGMKSIMVCLLIKRRHGRKGKNGIGDLESAEGLECVISTSVW